MIFPETPGEKELGINIAFGKSVTQTLLLSITLLSFGRANALPFFFLP